MKKILIALLVFSINALAADPIVGAIDCAQGGEMEKVKALVDKTLKAMKSDKDKVLTAITAKDKTYLDGSLYVFAYDKTTVIAHGFNEKLPGKDLVGAKDPAGTPFIVSLMRTALEKGEGCIKYQWPNPDKAGVVDDKIGYVKKFNDNIWVGSGTYQIKK